MACNIPLVPFTSSEAPFPSFSLSPQYDDSFVGLRSRKSSFLLLYASEEEEGEGEPHICIPPPPPEKQVEGEEMEEAIAQITHGA